MSKSWTKRVVVREFELSIVRAVVEEETKLTLFASQEFPEELQPLIRPGFSFDWTFCKGVYKITLPGSNPVETCFENK